VFAFVDGTRPREELIAASLGRSTSTKAANASPRSEQVSNHRKNGQRGKSSR